jgi:hypothetical protein
MAVLSAPTGVEMTIAKQRSRRKQKQPRVVSPSMVVRALGNAFTVALML